ncbi:MAG: hypothetical protein OXI91_06400 [Chloroflexota bacterium]|nr:hypothetical protein [Chloroflexota bacterium]
MPEFSAMEPFDEQLEAVEDYRQQARGFLARSWVYLREDDLHQASEKGWGAAAWMAKAVAEAQGWQYRRHDYFFQVMRLCQELSGDDRVRAFTNTANSLHGFFYIRKRLLAPITIADNLSDVEVFLDTLEPLTALEGQAAD